MLYMISVIVDTNGNDLGYRILDTSLIGKGNCTMDLSYTAVLNRLRTGGVIANLAVKNDKVVGTNGVIDRYSKVRIIPVLVCQDLLFFLVQMMDLSFLMHLVRFPL